MAIPKELLDQLRRQGEQIIADQAAQVGPMVQRAVAQQVNGLVEGLRQGQSLPGLIPAVPAAVDVKADARNRAERTFWQNLLIDLVIALAGTLTVALSGLDLSTSEAWVILGGLLLKTALSAPISYVMRTKFGVKDTSLVLPPAVAIPFAVSPQSSGTYNPSPSLTPPDSSIESPVSPPSWNLRGE